MQPLDTFPASDCRRIKGVFADIDDTITSNGRLTADAYAALESLQARGLMVFPITGRPAGWCDHIARMWPVDGVVGENGAFYFRYDPARREFNKRYILGDAERAANRQGTVDSWNSGATASTLTHTFIRRLECQLNSKGETTLQSIVRQLYGKADSEIRAVRVEPSIDI